MNKRIRLVAEKIAPKLRRKKYKLVEDTILEICKLEKKYLREFSLTRNEKGLWIWRFSDKQTLYGEDRNKQEK